MSQQNRETLKTYFETGDKPTQEQFEELIDSTVNKVEDFLLDYNEEKGVISVNKVSGKENSATDSVLLGKNAGDKTNQPGIIAIGTDAGQAGIGEYSVAIGHKAGASQSGNTYTNNFVGAFAGQNVTNSALIDAFGLYAAASMTGHSNVAVGFGAGRNSNGNFNVLIGSYYEGSTPFGAGRNQTGNHNIMLGGRTGITQTGSHNFIAGYFSAAANTGSNCIIMGNGEARGKTVGNNVISIGSSVSTSFTDYLDGDIVIGKGAFVRGNADQKKLGVGLPLTIRARERLDLGDDGSMIAKSVKMKSPNGKLWEIKVNDTGQLTTTEIV